MSFYSDLATLADGLLEEFGQSVTLRHYPSVPAGGYSPTYDTGTGEVSRGTPTDHAVNSVILSATSGKIRSFGLSMDENASLESMRFVLMAADGLAVKPSAQDQIYFDSKWWTVKGVTETNPAGTALIYGIGVQR